MRDTILLVDDSPTIRNLIRVYLMGLPYDFVEADSGARALAVLRSTSPKLAIVDINMAGMDGLAFLRELRSSDLPALRDLPLILLTGSRSDEDRQRGIAAGANEFLVKPVSRDQLLNLVQKFMGPIPARA